MLGQQANGIDLKCTEQSIPEFPNLLFGTQIDSGRPYFDATIFLQKEAPEKNIQHFFTFYQKPIESLCEAYDIGYGEYFKINKSGHYLIDVNFVYLFIAFVEPEFWGYIFDRIHDLFSQGVAVSDTYLLREALDRVPKELLEKIGNNAKREGTD
jgi:hypothetical protein